MPYRLDFEALAWTSPMPGVRHKLSSRDGRTLRLVEYSADMPPHWCERGHFGQILQGELELEFAAETLTLGPGAGVMIPGGVEHAHRARARTPTVLALFVEDQAP